MSLDLAAWAAFVAFVLVLVLLALDLLVFHRNAHAVSVREAAISIGRSEFVVCQAEIAAGRRRRFRGKTAEVGVPPTIEYRIAT